MHKTPTTRAVPLALLAGAIALAGCAVGPQYRKPDMPMPAAFKENSGWKPANPQPAASDAPWWSVYSDPVLDGLERSVIVNNQTLKANEAAYRAAHAQVGIARASFFPTIGLSATGNESGGRGTASSAAGSGLVSTNAGNSRRRFEVGASASWDLDLWGRIRRQVEESSAEAKASGDDLAAARLSIQAELATDYFALRAADAQKGLLDRTVEAFQQSLQITKNRYAVGVAGESDVITATTQLQNAQSQQLNIGIARATLEHAIGVLTGTAPESFALSETRLTESVPITPAGLPSSLLERRPDIAAAERRMASSNAAIGIAMAAFFPDLTLTGSDSTVATAMSGLFKASSWTWGFGPQLAQTLFSGGARIYQVKAARADYDGAVANYRQAVLTALQQVEDQLATLRILEQQAAVQNDAVASARKAEALALNQYKAGTVDYTTVIQAQTTRLNAELTALSLHNQRLAASVSLTTALGGGWRPTDAPLLTGAIPAHGP